MEAYIITTSRHSSLPMTLYVITYIFMTCVVIPPSVCRWAKNLLLNTSVWTTAVRKKSIVLLRVKLMLELKQNKVLLA